MIVAVRPPGAFPGSTLLNNGLFAGTKYNHLGDSTHWLRPYAALKQQAVAHGFELVTEDRADLNSTAALLIMDMPANLDELRAIRLAHPDLKLILQTIESVTGRLWTLDPANHRLFDAVISYDDRHRGKAGYFLHKIPAGGIDGWNGPMRDDCWEDRKLACMAAICKPAPPLFPRHTGLGMLRRGWRMSTSTWWNYISENNSLYGARREIAVALSDLADDNFDLFGTGWAERGPAQVRRCFRGEQSGSKLDFLGRYRFNIAFENCQNNCGYISEKIFDALLAGSVPVYLGNEVIERFVPTEAFVDARTYRSYAELADFLQSMPKRQWLEMREHGERFLRGDAITTFGQGQYIDAALAAINFSVGSPSTRGRSRKANSAGDESRSSRETIE